MFRHMGGACREPRGPATQRRTVRPNDRTEKPYTRTAMTTEFPIRVATPDDAVDVAAIYAPYVTRAAVSFEEVPPSGDAMRERIARVLDRHAWLVATTQGGVV